MIKWLKKITVAKQESQNFYHFRDNRVLPVGVTPESAESEGWWFKPDFIINELNIQARDRDTRAASVSFCFVCRVDTHFLVDTKRPPAW
jgi:hypothetical protein